MTLTKKLANLLSAATILSSSAAFAATQGTVGSTATGSATISITKPVQANISDVSDMIAPNWIAGDGAVTLTDNVCVYSSTGNYKVTATGSGNANAFTLGSGSNSLAYTVAWNAGGAGNLANTGTSLTSGTQTSGYTTASTTSTTCNGGGSSNDTARVIVGITSANMQSAAASNTPYTGTLTLMVTPY